MTPVVLAATRPAPPAAARVGVRGGWPGLFLLALLALASALVAVATLAYVRRPAPEPELPVTWTRTNATGLNAGPWSWTA